MKLRDFLHFNHLRATDLARDLNIAKQHLYNIKNDRIRPGKKLMAQIELLTGGQVTEEDFLDAETIKKAS